MHKEPPLCYLKISSQADINPRMKLTKKSLIDTLKDIAEVKEAYQERNSTALYDINQITHKETSTQPLKTSKISKF